MSSSTNKELQNLWDQVVEHIQPRSTRALVERTSKLSEFDYMNKIAIVHVTSVTWAKHHCENYVENIKTAFADVLRFSTDVSIVCEKENDEKRELEAQREQSLNLLMLDSAISACASKKSIQYPGRNIEEEITQEIATTQNEDKKVNNQGLDGTYQWNGLHFRSKSEIKIAQALDERGVLYFPNARGRLSLEYSRASLCLEGTSRRDSARVNREADFLVCYEGAWGILECDGEIYHQSAANDHARDLVWNANGIWFIKRFSSSECYENPAKVVDIFLKMLKLFSNQTGSKPQQ